MYLTNIEGNMLIMFRVNHICRYVYMDVWM